LFKYHPNLNQNTVQKNSLHWAPNYQEILRHRMILMFNLMIRLMLSLSTQRITNCHGRNSMMMRRCPINLNGMINSWWRWKLTLIGVVTQLWKTTSSKLKIERILRNMFLLMMNLSMLIISFPLVRVRLINLAPNEMQKWK